MLQNQALQEMIGLNFENLFGSEANQQRIFTIATENDFTGPSTKPDEEDSHKLLIS